MIKPTKLINETYYGILNPSFERAEPMSLTQDKNEAIKSLDSRYSVLVELKIIKVFTRNPEVVEIT